MKSNLSSSNLKIPKAPISSIPFHKHTISLSTINSLKKGSNPAAKKISQSFQPSTTKSKLSTEPTVPSSVSRIIKVPTLESIEDLAKWNSLTLPVSPEKVRKCFSQYLTSFEESEIMAYPEIFFIGIGSAKSQSGVKNSGFDDRERNYLTAAGDHLMYRYEILSNLGSGNFGKVVKVLDHKLRQEFAIKILKNKGKLSEDAREEIQVLEYLKQGACENKLIQLIESFYFRGHHCLKFELLGVSMYQYLKVNRGRMFSIETVRNWSEQILTALKYLHKMKVIHCDLKPGNIMFVNDTHREIKVIDLGSAIYLDKRIYNYIQTRYYRAPEVVLGLDYGNSIDIWSFGCVLAELLLGFPLFVAENEIELIQSVMEVLGTPSQKIIGKALNRNFFFEFDGKAKAIPNSKGRIRVPGSNKIRDIFKGFDENLVDLIERCITWEQNCRITAEEALRHSWITGLASSQSIKAKIKVEKPKKMVVRR